MDAKISGWNLEYQSISPQDSYKLQSNLTEGKIKSLYCGEIWPIPP